MIAVTQENSCGNQQAIPAGEVLDLQHLLQENHTLRWDRNFYKSLLERATAREALLKQEIQQLNDRIRYLEKRFYGRKSEKKTSKPKSSSSRRIKQKDTCMPMRPVGKSLSSLRAKRATVGICGFLFRTVP